MKYIKIEHKNINLDAYSEIYIQGSSIYGNCIRKDDVNFPIATLPTKEAAEKVLRDILDPRISEIRDLNAYSTQQERYEADKRRETRCVLWAIFVFIGTIIILNMML